MKLTKPTYHYFVSYTFNATNHSLGFGLSEIVRDTPILNMSDIRGIAEDIAQKIKSESAVIILNYIRLEA